MTQREKDLFYEVLELLRKEVRTSPTIIITV